MLSERQNMQKSLKRRFLLILGAFAFFSLLVLGGMFIFWSRLLPEMPILQKRLFGGFIIIYGIIRFQRVFRKEPDED